MERHLYVDASDVHTEDSKGFFGIAPGKVIRLKYGPAVKITAVEKTPKGLDVKGERISEEEAGKLKIKGVLNWISKKDSLKVEVRLYKTLFLVEIPKLDVNDPEGRSG